MELTNDCKISKLLEPGDVIMADRGVNIDDDNLPKGIKANIPPFSEKRKNSKRKKTCWEGYRKN